MIRRQCMVSPWHGAHFKKRFNCVEMVVFGNMIFGGRANSSLYIHARFRGDKYKLHHQKVMRKVLGLILTKWHVPPPVLPGSTSTFLSLAAAGDNTYRIHCSIDSAILGCWRHFCMLRLSKNSYLDDSAYELWMIPHTDFEIFDDSANKFWRMNAWWKRYHPYTLLLPYIKIFANKITYLHTPTTTFSFNWILVNDCRGGANLLAKAATNTTQLLSSKVDIISLRKLTDIFIPLLYPPQNCLYCKI